MAVHTIKCPNCNGQVKMDDDFEKGFCMYCGSAIQIRDEIAKIKIVHSGKVELDDSKKLSNAIELADRAFNVGNYAECYNYCCTALECDVDNAHMTFRKGLCAAYLSTARVNELEQALVTATKLIKSNSRNLYSDLYKIFCELFAYIRSSYIMDCERSKGFVYPSFAAANYTFTVIATLTNLCGECADLITEEMMAENINYENNKKECLEMGLVLCEQGISSVKYFAGYRQSSKDGYVEQQEVYETARSPFADMQRGFLTKFKNDYNNLPSTRNALMKFDGEIEGLQRDIGIFDERLEAYFGENPEIGKVYKRSALPFGALTGGVFLLLPATAIALDGKVSGTVMTVLMVLLGLAFMGVAIFSIIQWVSYSNDRKKILNELPPDLSNLRNIHDQSKTRLRTVMQEKATFVRKNVKD